MYDFLFKINSTSTYNPYEENIYFEKKEAESIVCQDEWFKLQGLSYTRNETFYSDNNNTIWIYGNIFVREKYVSGSTKGMLVENVLSDFLGNEDIHLKYKGNYCIFCINKNNRSLKIINSQLGLSHVYYYSNSNELVVSNNLSHFKHLNLEYNTTAVYQKLIFSYIISDDTFIKGVKRMNPGEIIDFKNNSLKKYEAAGINKLFEAADYEKFSVEKYTDIFNNSVKQRAECDENISVSFTGGFDGRTIISSMLNQGIPVNAYSFGKYDGENTRIPLNISKKIGINYNPVYLEEAYEEQYVDDAKKAIYFSDGISFNERANYIYAFRKLAEKSRYVLSGLIGGETLRPVHLRTDYMNENYYQIIYFNNSSLIDAYLNSEFIKSIFDGYDVNAINELKEIIFEIQKNVSKFKDSKKGFLYYLKDLMNTGFRMYYGTEIHLERQYCNNLTPYYDIDLLEYLFTTDYVEIFKQAFKSGKIHRWSGQKIYAEIIEQNFKELNKYSVDRGYPPGYLLNPIKLTLIPYLYYRRKNNRKYHIDFDEQKWSKLFLEDYLNNNYKTDYLFNNSCLKEKAVENLKNGIHSSDFNRILSLHTWFNQ